MRYRVSFTVELEAESEEEAMAKVSDSITKPERLSSICGVCSAEITPNPSDDAPALLRTH